MSAGSQRPLRPGDVVEVLPPADILTSLDENGALDSVPFMPEMLQYVGRRFTVSKRVEKICDTVAGTGSRRMRDTVYLEDLRCDGSGHGGCQAGCRIYWKEAWLRRVEDPGDGLERGTGSGRDLEQRAQSGSRTMREVDGEKPEVWRCQATEAFKATEPLKASDVRQYWRELASGNFGPLSFLRIAVRALVLQVASRMRLVEWVPLRGQGEQPTATEPLDLRPGELVQVRPPSEIASTLDAHGLNRGLSFDREMLPYCGRTYRVQDRVQRIIDERTGRMLHISRDCLILEGVVCSGERSVARWCCPRQIYPYWREAWLRRVERPREPAERQQRS